MKINLKSLQVSMHAVERAAERLGIQKHQAKTHIKQILRHATFVEETVDGVIYEHGKSGTRIVLNPSGRAVKTVYRVAKDEPIKKVLAPTLTDPRLLSIVKRAYAELEKELKFTMLHAKHQESKTLAKLYKCQMLQLDVECPEQIELLKEKEDCLAGDALVLRKVASEYEEDLEKIRFEFIRTVGEDEIQCKQK